MLGTPPYHVRLVWKDRAGRATSKVAIKGKTWPTVDAAKEALDAYLVGESMQGVEVLEQPTDELRLEGLTTGPIVRTTEIWDAANAAISGYTARFETEPLIEDAEKLLDPLVIQHFRSLDSCHGPWRVYLKFSPVDGGESLSRPLEKKNGVPVRYERLADLMITIIEMMKADFIPENGLILTSGSHRAAMELPLGKFRFTVYARGEDGHVYSFPDAPDVEDAMN
jgi:hypothetical protein